MNWGRFVAVVLGTVFLTTVGLSSASWAQNCELGADCGRIIIDRLENEAIEGAQSRKATDEALDLRKLDDAPVTYQDVLKDPDNVELNFRFARSQVSQGNFRGASSTLERILRLQPDLAQVRLLYAIVLFRLDNLGEAEREFQAIAGLDIDPETRTEIDRFIERIQLARRTTRYAASVSFGAHLDTNRTTAPRSNLLQAVVGGAEILVVVDRAEADIGYIGVANIRVDHNLGYQEGHEVFGSLTFFYDDQTAEDSLDLQSFTAEVGGTMRRAFEEIDVTPSLFQTKVRLSRESFLEETGASLRFDRAFGPGISGYTAFTLSTQTFDAIAENSTASERNGRQFSFTLGGSYMISGAQLLGVELQHLDKSSKGDFSATTGIVEKFVSFEREQLRLNHTWLLGGGQFLLNSFTYQRDRYEDPDSFTSAKLRRDDIFRYRVTYGAPLSFIFGEGTLPEVLGDISFTPSVEVLRSMSNINNNDYENVKVQALLTKSWRF